jgi:hypothetical protein
MSRAKKSPASRKARKNQALVKQPIALDLEHRNSWTPKMAANWAGMPERALYRLLREGVVPCLPMGGSQTQNWPKARDKQRRRACFRYVIPRVAFIRWFETLGKPEMVGSREKVA